MIFVTGGTGLVGSHLLAELTKKDVPITAIYRNPEKIKTVQKIFEFYHKEKASKFFNKIKWEKCDVLDIPRLEELMENHDEVYHCAAIVSFKKRDFSRMIQINRYGTANMVNVALAKNIKKFCYVSSTAAVGNKDVPSDELVDEEGKWILTDETSGYSIAKYSAEKEVWRGAEEGLNVVIVNPSIVFGAGNWKESSLVIFNTIKKGLRFYSPGSNAFVDARDVARIMIQLTDNNIFNQRFLCIGENTTFKNVFETIAQRIGKSAPKHQVSKVLMGFAWRISVFWSVITFTSPAITKSSAQSAFKKIKFSNKKIREKLNYNFFDLKEMVDNAVEFELNHK